MEHPNKKLEFMHTECWLLSIGAAFQRSHVYSTESTDPRRKAFRQMLRRKITDDLLPHYRIGNVTDVVHISNIQQLCDKATQEYFSILHDGRFRFGTAQKLVNLYLKYLWCLGEVKTPPHFPVDRRIQIEMGFAITKWTTLDSAEAYMDIITEARNKYLPRYHSLAEMELQLFGRSAEDE